MSKCNCLQKILKKKEKILGKYVEFTPHSKNLDGINALKNEELVRQGFIDVNTTLANTLKALENVLSKGYTNDLRRWWRI